MQQAGFIQESIPLDEAGPRPSGFERIEAGAGLALWGISSCTMLAASVWAIHKAYNHPDLEPNYWLFVVIALLCDAATVVSGWFIVRGLSGRDRPCSCTSPIGTLAWDPWEKRSSSPGGDGTSSP